MADDPETIIEIVPSEDLGFVCSMLIKNDVVDGCLRLTIDDVNNLIHELDQYA